MTDRDWREPRFRRDAFQRFYSFHLTYQSHPGMVYSMLPAIADAFDLDADGRAWLVWLNGNTQNVVSSLMLLEAAPRPEDWKSAVDFWNDNFRKLEWDTDRRHQKSKFGEATALWSVRDFNQTSPAYGWFEASMGGWEDVWKFSKDQPYMGRLSAWSMMEYAKILFPDDVPDMGSWLLEDKSGSQSHRNGLAFIRGYDSVYWDADVADMMGIVEELTTFADELLDEARARNPLHPDVSRLTMESALCTYKGWHKPNRRYPNCYADMMYNRIKKAETRFDRSLDLLWKIRQNTLPDYLRLEDNPYDPGLVAVKQNHYLETGEPIMMHRDYEDMQNDFNLAVDFGLFDERVDPSWAL